MAFKPSDLERTLNGLTPMNLLSIGRLLALDACLSSSVLPLEAGRQMNYVQLVRGILANASLDGNGLSEEQVDRLFEGSLELPAERGYLRTEVENLVRVTRVLVPEMPPAHGIDPQWLARVNSQLLHGLPGVNEGSVGSYRVEGDPVETAAGITSHMIPAAIDALAASLSSEPRPAGVGIDEQALLLIRALLVQFDLMRIQPFAQANGRTARTATYGLLRQAGVTSACAHIFCVEAATSSKLYHAHFRGSPPAATGAIHFVAYMVDGALAGMQRLFAETGPAVAGLVQREQLDNDLDGIPGKQATRLRALLLALGERDTPIGLSKIPGLSPALTGSYGRMDPKTLIRDLSALHERGMVERSREGYRLLPPPMQPFQVDLLRANGAS